MFQNDFKMTEILNILESLPNMSLRIHLVCIKTQLKRINNLVKVYIINKKG